LACSVVDCQVPPLSSLTDWRVPPPVCCCQPRLSISASPEVTVIAGNESDDVLFLAAVVCWINASGEIGVDVGSGVGVAVELGVALGEEVGVGVGSGVGVGVGVRVGVGVGVDVRVGVGVGVWLPTELQVPENESSTVPSSATKEAS